MSSWMFDLVRLFVRVNINFLEDSPFSIIGNPLMFWWSVCSVTSPLTGTYVDIVEKTLERNQNYLLYIQYLCLCVYVCALYDPYLGLCL